MLLFEEVLARGLGAASCGRCEYAAVDGNTSEEVDEDALRQKKSSSSISGMAASARPELGLGLGAFLGDFALRMLRLSEKTIAWLVLVAARCDARVLT